MVTKKDQEEARRHLANRCPKFEVIDAKTYPDLYQEITSKIWCAWDRRGHTGHEDGLPPAAYARTGQRKSAEVPMLWALSPDGLWRDFAWRQLPSRKTEDRVMQACKAAVQAQIDDYAEQSGVTGHSRFCNEVDHAVTPHIELIRAWVAENGGFDSVAKHIASKPGVTWDEVLRTGTTGREGATGQKIFADTEDGRRFSASYAAYHAERAVLQILDAKTNRQLGSTPHPVMQANNTDCEDDERIRAFFDSDD